jgi:hypothetical protein
MDMFDNGFPRRLPGKHKIGVSQSLHLLEDRNGRTRQRYTLLARRLHAPACSQRFRLTLLQRRPPHGNHSATGAKH